MDELEPRVTRLAETEGGSAMSARPLVGKLFACFEAALVVAAGISYLGSFVIGELNNYSLLQINPNNELFLLGVLFAVGAIVTDAARRKFHL